MKKIIWMSLFLSVVMLLMPITVVKGGSKDIEIQEEEAVAVIKKDDNLSEDIFRIYNHQSGKVEEMKSEDYIFGVVAAEMPALYHKEAIKAQAVAAYTYACYSRKNNSEKEYDLSTDYNTSQSFIKIEDVEKKWGSKAEEYTKKIREAIEETQGYTIKYKGEIILSVYHAISGGKTEDSGNVWGKDYPYLKSVDSSFDKEAENFSVETEFTLKEIKERLGDKIAEDISPEDYFGDISLSKTGLVKKIDICKKTYTGAEIREILELRSSNFDVEYKDERFIFTTRGYGHGVGMSQYGANALAKDGKKFDEILKYFYKDCTVEK